MSSDAQNQFIEGLVKITEHMAPVIEMASAQRQLLEKQGWSPTAAEAYALKLLLGMTRLIFTGQGGKS